MEDKKYPPSDQFDNNRSVARKTPQKKQKKNGFTLVELLITIGLLSLLGVLIANNMVSIQSKQLQSNYENYKKQIADAACLYIESKDITPNKIYKFYNESTGTINESTGAITSKNDCISNGECYVKTKKLIDDGYLDKDLQNPATGRSVTNTEIVRIQYIDGEKKCLYFSA